MLAIYLSGTYKPTITPYFTPVFSDGSKQGLSRLFKRNTGVDSTLLGFIEKHRLKHNLELSDVMGLSRFYPKFQRDFGKFLTQTSAN